MKEIIKFLKDINISSRMDGTELTIKLDHNEKIVRLKKILKEAIKKDGLNRGVETIELKGKMRDFTVNLKDIIMIEKIKNKTYFYTSTMEGYLSLTLESCENLQASFMRINKSQIVNLDNIVDITPIFNSRILLKLIDDTLVEVNRRYKKNFDKRIRRVNYD